MSGKPIVLNIHEWNTSAIKYLPPKVNDKGGKAINIISTQNNRALCISTPLLMTWGISDYVNDQGVSDGRYSLSLTFPNEEYRNENTDLLLKKLKEFEEQFIQDAVKNSESWFGNSLTYEVVKHMFFPILKFSKNKDTKKIDLSKPPSLRAKVPNYNGKWNVELYDPQLNLIFPCENETRTPIDMVPKMSSVACVINLGGAWISAKSFGIQLKLVQAVVKPRLVESVYGKCHIQLSLEDKQILENDKSSTVSPTFLDTTLSDPRQDTINLYENEEANPSHYTEDSDHEDMPQIMTPEVLVSDALQPLVEVEDKPIEHQQPLFPPTPIESLNVKKKIVKKAKV